MSLFFLFNNLHFALEILGSLAFAVVAWLVFDAFLVRRDFLTASRGIGFLLYAGGLLIHALDFATESYVYAGYTLYILGLFFIILNLIQEAPVERPKFNSVIILPSLLAVRPYLDIVVTVGLAVAALLSYHQYRKESKYMLVPLIWSFVFLALGQLTAFIYGTDSFGPLAIAGHLFELIGYLAITWWVWSYLSLRVREEISIILVSVTLLIAVLISLTFSTILVGKIESSTLENLTTNTRVLSFAIDRLKEEAKAKAGIAAARDDLREALSKGEFDNLEKVAARFVDDENLGFVTIVNADGDVIVRTRALSAKGDNELSAKTVQDAMSGEGSVAIESDVVEGFSIRAASPILGQKGTIVGAVITGFQLDNAFVDSIKKITGLEMSIFEGKRRVATTVFNLDGATRSVGIGETDPQVIAAVFQKRQPITLPTTILSRPFLASYLPITDTKDNAVIGMLSSAKAQREIVETVNETNRLTLLTAVVIMLILSGVLYRVTRRLGEEVA